MGKNNSDEPVRSKPGKVSKQSSAESSGNDADRGYMSVREMGDLLGLKKTDRYWLLHKGFFETKIAAGKYI